VHLDAKKVACKWIMFYTFVYHSYCTTTTNALSTSKHIVLIIDYYAPAPVGRGIKQ